MQDDMQFLEANKYLIRYHYVYKYKSFHRAAENFYIAGTDRNMKYTVDQLENFYKVQLVRVIGNKLEFTDFGHLLGEHAEQIYNLNLKINSILNKMNLKEVNFSISNDIYKYYVKPIFEVFQKENPDTKITLIKTNQYDATQRLLNREIDFIVGLIPSNCHPELTYQKIAEGKIYLVSLKSNENKFKDIKSLNDIKEFKGATLDFTEPFYYNLKEIEKKENIILNIVYSTSDIESLIEVVRNNFADYSLMGNYIKFDDLAFLDVSSLFNTIEVCFIYRKNESLTPAIEKLIKISKKLNIKPIE